MKSWANNRHKLIITDEKGDKIKEYIKENSYTERLNDLTKAQGCTSMDILVIDIYPDKIPCNSIYEYLPRVKNFFSLKKPQFIRFKIKYNVSSDNINFLFDGVNFYRVRDFYHHDIDNIYRSNYYMVLTTLSIDDPLYYELSNESYDETNGLYYLIDNTNYRDIIKCLYNINDSIFMRGNEYGHIHDKICRSMITGPAKFNHGIDVCEESYFIYPKNDELYIQPKNLEFINFKLENILDFTNCTQYVEYNYQKLVKLAGDDQIYMAIVDLSATKTILRKCRLEFDSSTNMIKIVMEDVN